ncbi:hypothetical protein C1H46_035721 [Malus baccata]|uniref:Uncharacterized protein n=1 Tax=Malus baccata TaxID=106549 RepID=A0A540KWY3_MALBA|nr:hypothetical protein C1H46_035721 [Malus baccata]
MVIDGSTFSFLIRREIGLVMANIKYKLAMARPSQQQSISEAMADVAAALLLKRRLPPPYLLPITSGHHQNQLRSSVFDHRPPGHSRRP